MGFYLTTSDVATTQASTSETAYPLSAKAVSGLRFYVPDTGRWASRDPIEEEGGILVYGFILNNPITGYDPDGQKRCDCGKDNTAGLKAALEQAETLFHGATLYKKVWGCFTMFIHPTASLFAWDLQFASQIGGDDECKQSTVTVEGQCANEWDVNYALYGRGAKVCKLFFVQAKANIFLYKAVLKTFANLVKNEWKDFSGSPDSLIEFNPQPTGWAKYGYDGTVPTPDPKYKDCRKSSDSGPVSIIDWPWK
jgi:RHS repeat-associated protein